MSAAPIRILLVDDHAVVRAGYRRLIEGAGAMQVVAEAATGPAAYRRALDGGLDVIVMDLSLPGVGGLEVTRRLCHRRPDSRVLAFSVHEEGVFVQRAFAAGALGYLSKRSDADEMLRALDQVARGQRYLDPALAARGVDGNLLERLSQREFEIFRQIAAGRSIGEIANDLCLSGKTISNYATQIRQKLGATNATDLARVAIAAGVVPL